MGAQWILLSRQCFRRYLLGVLQFVKRYERRVSWDQLDYPNMECFHPGPIYVAIWTLPNFKGGQHRVVQEGLKLASSISNTHYHLFRYRSIRFYGEMLKM